MCIGMTQQTKHTHIHKHTQRLTQFIYKIYINISLYIKFIKIHFYIKFMNINFKFIPLTHFDYYLVAHLIVKCFAFTGT